MKKEKLHVVLPIILLVLVYLVWIEWDYRSILPPVKQSQPAFALGGPPQVWSGHKLLHKNPQ